jgi:hypothetical protein
MKILKVKKHFLGGETDVSLEAPEFENFGNRLEEVQRLADEANPIDPEEVRASTADMMEQMKTQMEEARKKHEAMPAGPKKAMDSMMLGMLEKMAKTAAQAQEESEQPDDEDEDEEGDVEEEEKRNLQLLNLTVHAGIKWNKNAESMLEQFFADWPQLRSVVLRGVFEYYKGIYPELVDAYDYHKGRQFFIPEPTSPEAIQDIFYVQGIDLHKDGSMGLSGFCTWDEEHGFGVRLKDGKVTDAGAADIAY